MSTSFTTREFFYKIASMASLKQKLLEVDFTPVHLSTRLGKEKQGMCISLSWVSQIVAKSKIACLDLLDINGTSGYL